MKRNRSAPLENTIPAIRNGATNAIAVASPNGKILTTKPGVTAFDPAAPDDVCLTSPNDVPLTLMVQSPIFESQTFDFGPTDVGTTQYLDAFQRGNFWRFVGGTPYHTILNPHVLAPVIVNLPGKQGLAGSFVGASGPLAIVNFAVMKQQIFNQLLASESAKSTHRNFRSFCSTTPSWPPNRPADQSAAFWDFIMR